MCSARICRDAPVSMGRQAVVLLLAVLAHVAFMASPLHAAMLERAAPPLATEISDAEGPARVDPARPDGEHAGHCRLRWTTARQSLDIVQFVAAVHVPALAGPLPDFAGRSPERPAVRALGPPVRGDPHALLQVFRE